MYEVYGKSFADELSNCEHDCSSYIKQKGQLDIHSHRFDTSNIQDGKDTNHIFSVIFSQKIYLKCVSGSSN